MPGRELQQALDRAELADLTQFLATAPGAMAIDEARGFLTAIASAPTTIMPTVWQEEVLGEGDFASLEHANHVFGLLVRLYNQIVGNLSEGKPVAPSSADDETLGRWCAGYLKAAQMDEVWTADERGNVFLFPVTILAGEFDLVGETDSDGNVIEDPAPQLRRCRERLDSTVHEANAYWTAWRRSARATPIVTRSHKVGRNEPCPCGSGLKFKKCCALKD